MKVRAATAALPTNTSTGTQSSESLRVWSLWGIVKRQRVVLLVSLMLILISRAAALVIPLVTRIFLDSVIRKGNKSLLLPLTLAVLGAYTVQAIANWSIAKVLSSSALRFIGEMRCRLQDHIGRLPLAFHDTHKVGELVSRVMNDVEGLRNLVGAGLVEFVGGIVSSVLAVAIMFWIDRMLTSIALCAMAVFAVVLRSVFARLRPLFRQRSELQARVNGRLSESFGGIRIVKGYNGEDRESATFMRGAGDLVNNGLTTLNLSASTTCWTTILTGLTGAVIVYAGGGKILSGALQPGQFVMFMILLTYITGPILQVISIAGQISESLAGIAKTRQILNQSLEEDDPLRTETMAAWNGNLRFESVGFNYENGPSVLDQIDFIIRPGTVTALVGPSGSGKTTIIGLAAGFYAPVKGKIHIDERDLRTLRLASFRQHLGLVLQETFLFDGTIRENILFSHPHATEPEFLEACRVARLHEVVERFPGGYDTVIGERGVRLSGGQRQRISIARAVLLNPKLLILDEATSNLDSESEDLIQRALSELMKGRTTLVIAHRLSTVRQADQILYVEDGKIAERGTHRELIARHGKYFELYRRQHDSETNLLHLSEEEVAVVEESATSVSPAKKGPTIMQEALSLLR